MRQPCTQLVDQWRRHLVITDAHMYMHTEDQDGAPNILVFLLQHFITLVECPLLFLPACHWMCTSTDQSQPLGLQQLNHCCVCILQIETQSADRRTDIRYHL